MIFASALNNRQLWAASIILTQLIATPVFARVDYTLSQEVTATHAQNQLADEPVHTEIIDAEALSRQNATDLQSALKYASAVLLKDIHGKAGQAAWIQGFSGAHVLVLVDGEKVTSTTDSGVDLTQVSVNDIERIEIVKGAGSALYGSSAVGGAINIVTKKAQSGTSGKLVLQAGQYQQKRDGGRALGDIFAAASFAYRQPKVSFNAAIDERNTDGYQINAPKLSQMRFGEQGFRRNLRANLELSPVLSHSFYLRASRYAEDYQEPHYVFLPGLGDLKRENNEEVTDDKIAVGAHLFKHSNHQLQLSAYRQQFYNLSRHQVVRRAYIDSDNAKLQYSFSNAKLDNLIVGADLNQEKLRQYNNGVSEFSSDQPSRQSREFFTQYDTFIKNNLQILLGARNHYSSNHGNHFMPKLALLYYQNGAGLEHKWRLNYGAGYRLASIKEQHFVFDHSVYGYKVMGNPKLAPEKSQSWQLGYEASANQTDHISVNLFYTKIKNLIDTDYTGMQDGNKIFQYINRDGAYTSGMELEFNKQFKALENHIFDVNGSYVYLNSVNDSQDLSGKQLPQRPRHVFKLLGSYQYQRHQLSIGMRATGSQYLDGENQIKMPSFVVWDGKYRYRVGDNFSFYLGVDNIGNQFRDPNKNNDARANFGRFFYAGSRYSF